MQHAISDTRENRLHERRTSSYPAERNFAAFGSDRNMLRRTAALRDARVCSNKIGRHYSVREFGRMEQPRLSYAWRSIVTRKTYISDTKFDAAIGGSINKISGERVRQITLREVYADNVGKPNS